MHIAASPLISNHRLARALSWARLWLAWIAGVAAHFVGGLPVAIERTVCAQVDQCGEIVARVIFLRACARCGLPAPHRQSKGPARRRRSATLRVVIGSALRRDLRGRGLRGKLEALADVVCNAEIHIGNLARRLARGLTRRRVFAFAPEFAPGALAASCVEVFNADSS